MQQSTSHESLKGKLASLRKEFCLGGLDKYTYLSEKHVFNQLLMEYTSQIKNTSIESIKILENALIFSFKSPINLELETDGGARSAPFEILNFGCYEPEDESMAYTLIEDGNTILDIGAHIGWYAINFAKRFPQSKIFAFEPIENTFNFLKRNIERNRITNATIYNYGCYNREEEKIFYYFQGGSAIASIENLIDHKNAKEIICTLKTIDSIVCELQLQSVDFIKCDAEGSELFILQGAKQTIKRFNPIILIELYEEWCQRCGYLTADVLDLLKLHGYKPFQAINGELTEVKLLNFNNDDRCNYFFLNSVKHKELIDNYSHV